MIDIAFVGAGNLASHMAPALARAGYRIVGVASRTREHAHTLAQKIPGAFFTDRLSELPKADVYILAVGDDALATLHMTWHPPSEDALVLHTSGTVSIDTIRRLSRRVGVLYPLQTFSKDRSLDFKEIPCFVEASDTETEKMIVALAQSISHEVHLMDSSTRRVLHLAAVFACNFVNHLYDVASQQLLHRHLHPEWLRPLILETARKVLTMSPYEAQTGPARRGDSGTLDRHQELLADHSEWQSIYQVMSQSIFQRFHS